MMGFTGLVKVDDAAYTLSNQPLLISDIFHYSCELAAT